MYTLRSENGFHIVTINGIVKVGFVKLSHAWDFILRSRRGENV